MERLEQENRDKIQGREYQELSTEQCMPILMRILKLCERPQNPAIAYRNLESIELLVRKIVEKFEKTSECGNSQ